MHAVSCHAGNYWLKEKRGREAKEKLCIIALIELLAYSHYAVYSNHRPACFHDMDHILHQINATHILGGGGYFCFWSTIPYDWTAVIPEYSSRIYRQAAFCMNVTLSICILLSPEQCSRTMNYFPVISTLLTLMITCELFHHKEVKNLLLNTCMK